MQFADFAGMFNERRRRCCTSGGGRFDMRTRYQTAHLFRASTSHPASHRSGAIRSIARVFFERDNENVEVDKWSNRLV